jgi:hypothetical protein
MKRTSILITVCLLVLFAFSSLCPADYVISPYKTVWPLFYDDANGTYFLLYDPNQFYLSGHTLRLMDSNFSSISDYVARADGNYPRDSDANHAKWNDPNIRRYEADPCFALWLPADVNNTKDSDANHAKWNDPNIRRYEADPCFALWLPADANNVKQNDPNFINKTDDVNYAAFDSITDPNADANDLQSMRTALGDILTRLKANGVINP